MAKQKEYYWSGKLHWCRPFRLNQWGKYSAKFYPNAEALQEIRKLKETDADGVRGIQTVIGKDEDGEYITLNRAGEATFRGIKQSMGPVRVVDGTKQAADGSYMPMSDQTQFGNGTDGMVKVIVYKHRVPTSPGKFGRAMRWESLRVDNLVPYEGAEDLTAFEFKQVDGLAEQAKPNW